MHFKILVEDQSGEKALEIIVPKIIGSCHTFEIHPYKGAGPIPKGLGKTDANKRILLDRLPKLLRGIGKTFSKYPEDYRAAVVVVCDLDNKNCKDFLAELNGVLNSCNPRPETRFCIAIEEGEAWFLGDIPAIKRAYPKARNKILKKYVNDSVCGTWELLADAIFPGGREKLSARGWSTVGAQKSEWAEKISPHMDVQTNKSPSFNYFRNKLLELTELDKTA